MDDLQRDKGLVDFQMLRSRQTSTYANASKKKSPTVKRFNSISRSNVPINWIVRGPRDMYLLRSGR